MFIRQEFPFFSNILPSLETTECPLQHHHRVSRRGRCNESTCEDLRAEASKGASLSSHHHLGL